MILDFIGLFGWGWVVAGFCLDLIEVFSLTRDGRAQNEHQELGNDFPMD
jgi:hypothetical protein